MINISITPYWETNQEIPYRQANSGYYEPPPWGRGPSLFGSDMSPFYLGSNFAPNPWLSFNDTLTNFVNNDNTNTDNTSDYTPPYPIGPAGRASAITNGYFITCSGQILKTLDETNPFTVYKLRITDLDDPEGYKDVVDLLFESESYGLYGPGKVEKILIKDSLVYILINDPAGLYIVDITDIEAPELVSYHDLGFAIAEDMEIQNDWAFIVFNDYDSIIASWDISNPLNISFSSYIIIDGWVKDIFMDQEILLTISDGSHNGLNIIDISNPEEMEILDYYNVSGQAVWMTGGGILTAGGVTTGCPDSGFWIIETLLVR